MSRLANWLRGAAAFVVGSIVTLAALEVVLQLLPVQRAYGGRPAADWPVHHMLPNSQYTFSSGWALEDVRHGHINNLGYAAIATLDIPVWDWFTTRDKVRQSEINRQAAKVVLSNTQRKAIADLEENYAEAVAAHDQLDSLDRSVATAQESLRLTRLSYFAGESPILEVVDAENSFTAAEIAREDGLVRYQTALANLQMLTGTL